MKLSVIYRMVPFLMTVNDPSPRFHGHALFDVEYLRNSTRQRPRYNRIL